MGDRPVSQPDPESERWRIYKATNSMLHAVLTKEPWEERVEGPDTEWVEVVPVSELARLKEALEKISEGMAWWATKEDMQRVARAALRPEREGE